MPKGPQGQKRPADVIGNAVRVMEIATGQREEEFEDDGKNKAAVELGRKGCQRRSKISPPGRSKTSPLNVMRYAVLGGCPGSP